jgi:hypothetical protein
MEEMEKRMSDIGSGEKPKKMSEDPTHDHHLLEIE